MLELTVDVSGVLPDLSKGQISRLTRSVASRVRKQVILATPVGDRPKAIGEKRAKDSWTPVRKDSGGYSFSNPLVQTFFLEKGSPRGKRPWPNVPENRPRTVYNKGRVYSSQAPKGITAKANVDVIGQQIATELLGLLVQGKSIAQR